MTASAPPPAMRGTAAFYLERAAAASRLVALLLVATVSVRFAVAAAHHALDATSANFDVKPRANESAAPSALASAPRARASGRAAAEPPPAATEGPSVRIALGVSAGPARSEVYVSGNRVGNTPFLGDMACKVGQRLKIEIVPPEPEGVPLVYERICSPGILRIDGSED